MTDGIEKEFTAQCIHRIEENIHKLTTCLEELEEHDIWKRPNQNSNSVGNLILHLCGNIRQYAISSLSNTGDVRARDQEFSAQGGLTKSQLLEKFLSTAGEAKHVIQNLPHVEFLKIREVQGFHYSGIGIIVHVTEHLSYHTGQVIFWTKLLKDKDLAFYAGIDLNQKNKI